MLNLATRQSIIEDQVGTNFYNKIFCGNNIDILRQLPAKVVDTVVTSPPYYGQRDYKVNEQIGSESSPELYISKLRDIFSEVHRVLKDDGTLWLNLGDKYINGKLMGLPWRVALALNDSEWILRSDIIWHKPNAMPSSVKSRPTTDHEYIFLFSKSAKYTYHADAIREEHVTFTAKSKMRGGRNHFGKDGGTPENGKNKDNPNLHHGRWDKAFHPKGRNKRTVWSVSLGKFREAHFAVFPETLITPCVLAGSKEGGIILDPFLGSGTSAVVALKNRRQFIGIDINEEYCLMAEDRIKKWLW